MSLKEADMHIKEGNFAAALEAIARVRKADPTNQYALAYEERVRALIRAKEREKQSQHSSMSASGKDTPQKSDSSGAWQASDPVAPQTQQRPSPAESQYAAPRKPDDTERRKQDELRRTAILAKIAALVSRAKEYEARNEFARALDELERAYLLDPANKVVRALEQQLRSAQEEASKRQQQEREQQVQEEEQRRVERLKAALARVQREQEEKRLKEAEARTAAQRQKVEQHLQRARDLITDNRLTEAQSELAFIGVIDPQNHDVHALAKQIVEKQEQQRQAELELYRRKEEEHRKKQEAIRLAVQKHIENATAYAGQGNFNEALRVITRAYVMDPTNEDLQACETRIQSAHEAALKQAEVQRQKEEEDFRRRQEEEHRHLENAEREHLLRGNDAKAEAKRKADREAIQQHLSKVQQFLSEHRYENALAEVALAFLVDPFDEDVKRIEQEVLNAQTKEKEREQEAESILTAEEDADGGIAISVAAHLEEAERCRATKDYAKALNEIAKAFVLDPFNASVQKLEDDVQSEVLRTQDDERKKKETEDRQNAVQLHRTLAQEYLDHGSYEEAQREVNDGLKIDPGDNPLHALAGKIEKAAHKVQSERQEQPKEPDHAGHQAATAQQHLLRARELAAKKSFDEALAEIAFGLTISPEDAALQALEKEIWQARPQSPGQGAQESVAEESNDTDNQRLIKMHMLAAEEYAKNGEFSQALDELARAYIIDPLNKEARQLEHRIRQQEVRQQQPAAMPLKLIYPNKEAADGH